jgi:hypothetical protein
MDRKSNAAFARLVVLDELHKMTDWKSWLKGVFAEATRPGYR